MANMMGSWSVWVKDGVVKQKGVVGDNTPSISSIKLKSHKPYSFHDWRKDCLTFYFVAASKHPTPVRVAHD